MTNKAKTERRKAQPFDLSGGVVCLDFINTLDNRPDEHPKELLNSYADLVQFGEESGIVDAAQAERLLKEYPDEGGRAQSALGRAIQLREALYAIFSAIIARREAPAPALHTLNVFLHAAGDHSVLGEKKGTFSWSFSDRFSCDAVVWPIAASAGELLVSEQLPFVRTCSSESCQWFFLDTSKNHRRRWCNMKVCGNRAKVRRFYEKNKGD